MKRKCYTVVKYHFKNDKASSKFKGVQTTKLKTYISASSSLRLVSAEKDVPRLRSVSSWVLKNQSQTNIILAPLTNNTIQVTLPEYNYPLKILFVPIWKFPFLHVSVSVFNLFHINNTSCLEFKRIILEKQKEKTTYFLFVCL